MRILVVEDDLEAQRYLVQGLKESGHVVDEAADGVVPQVPAAAAARGELRRRPLALLPVELRTRLPAARAEQLRDNYENGSHQREPFFIVSRINGTCAIHEKIMPA